MPKSYEPEDFENCYSNFLEEKLSGREPSGPSYYIDPDCEADIGKTEFYNDLTDFLNEREERFVEERFIEEKNKYLYLPPSESTGTAKWLENHEGWGGLKRDPLKIAVLKNSEQNSGWLFRLTSDQFGFSAAEGIYEREDKRYPLVKLLYSCRGKCEEERKEIIGRITEYVKNSWTLGGSFLWPVLDNRRISNYNTARGVGRGLEDRVDLTLLEVKHALDCAGEKKCDYKEYKKDILYAEYEKDATHMREWLEHFGTFTKFVEYFMLEPFCKMKPTVEESYEYIPINIIDGSGIEEKKEKEEIKEIAKVRDLQEKEILNMLDRLEGMILVRTANMERAVRCYRDEFEK